MNPQGITLSVEQKQRLARLAGQYKIPVIEDDVYLELNHSDTFHLPAAYYDNSGYIIWCGSFSKSLSPSYRLGWCRPNTLLAQYLQLSQGATTYIQLAIAEFIRCGDYKRHLKQTRYLLAQNKQQYINYLSKHLPQGSAVTQPDGGLVLWIQVPNLDAKRLASKARQTDLDIRTGDLFTQSQRYRDCVRINIGYAFNDKTKALLDALLELFT